LDRYSKHEHIESAIYAMNDLPQPITLLVDELATMRGAVAVVLGGSRAVGSADTSSDWDIGLYYRGGIDLTTLSARGVVYPPGSWGRIMNGGAWLRCDGHRVDVLLRDLDVVEHWMRRAAEGEFEVDALLGYVAGVPTYTLAAELASCRVLHGAIPTNTYPEKLAVAGPPRWRFCRSFSVSYARAHATRGNLVGAIGQTAKAVMEEAHAIMCERGEWVCNEKRLIEAAGLAGTQSLFSHIPTERAGLIEWVDLAARHLGVEWDEMPPWAADE
jgi:hypothetical protein